jgi:hypothetical protein
MVNPNESGMENLLHNGGAIRQRNYLDVSVKNLQVSIIDALRVYRLVNIALP